MMEDSCLSASVWHKSSFGMLWGYCSDAIVVMLFIPVKNSLFQWEHCCLCQSGNKQLPRRHKLTSRACSCSGALLSMKHDRTVCYWATSCWEMHRNIKKWFACKVFYDQCLKLEAWNVFIIIWQLRANTVYLEQMGNIQTHDALNAIIE